MVSVSEQAAYWWAVNTGEASVSEQEQFGDWVARSPERVEAYLRISRVHAALRRDLRWPTTPAKTLIEDAKAAPAEPVALRPNVTFQRAAPRRHVTPVAFGLAASLLISICVTWLIWTQPEQFETQLGEHRVVQLQDGSTVTLNTKSRIEVRMADDRRTVWLVHGEALFQVAPDAKRPFYVDAGDATVRVVGTEFNVRRQTERTAVTVLDGRVALITAANDERADPPLLLKGDRAIVSSDGSNRIEHGVDVAAVTAWLQSRLVFQRRPLVEAVEEFNRYNAGKIQLRSAELGTEEITGTFRSNDLPAFALFIAGMPGAEVVSDGRGGYIVTMDPTAVDDP